MEKRAVVAAGYTPSEVSGKTSAMVKNEKALAEGEKDNISVREKRLAAQMDAAYNNDR